MSELQTPEQKELAAEHEILINDCMDRESQLTPWEQNFIQSLFDQMKDPWFIQLTDSQISKLEEIWERVTHNSKLSGARFSAVQ